MVFLRLEVELSERERETAQLKGWSRGQIDDARELSGAAWWCLAIGCGFPRHALTEDGRCAAKASLDTQHAKTGELADCPGRKPDCLGRARIFGVVTVGARAAKQHVSLSAAPGRAQLLAGAQTSSVPYRAPGPMSDARERR